jgi:integrase
MAKTKRKTTGRTRGNNTGSVWRDRQTGKLYALVTWTITVDGKPKQKRKTRLAISGTMREAYSLIPELQAEVEADRQRATARQVAELDGTAGHARDVNPKTLTLGQLATYYFEDVLTAPRFDLKTKKKKSGRVSWKDLRRKINRLVAYFGPNKLVANLTVGQIRKFKTERLNQAPIARYKLAGTDQMHAVELKDVDGGDRTITDATVHRDLRALSPMLNYAVAEQWLDRNPMIGHKDLVQPSNEYAREMIATVEAEHALIDHCHTEKKRETLAPYLVVMFNSGCRSSELRRMRVRDVDFTAAVEGVADVGVFKTHTFKGEFDERETVMTPAARAALLVACAGKQLDDFVFSYDVRKKDAAGNDIKNEDGTYVIEHRERKYAPRRSFASAKRDAMAWSKGKIDLTGLRGHDVRHTVVTRLMECGETAESAGRHVGHKQPQTTWRYYNPNRASGQRIANKLANYGKSEVIAFKRKRKTA